MVQRVQQGGLTARLHCTKPHRATPRHEAFERRTLARNLPQILIQQLRLRPWWWLISRKSKGVVGPPCDVTRQLGRDYKVFSACLFFCSDLFSLPPARARIMAGSTQPSLDRHNQEFTITEHGKRRIILPHQPREKHAYPEAISSAAGDVDRGPSRSKMDASDRHNRALPPGMNVTVSFPGVLLAQALTLNRRLSMLPTSAPTLCSTLGQMRTSKG
jgi:hypothetical protein